MKNQTTRSIKQQANSNNDGAHQNRIKPPSEREVGGALFRVANGVIRRIKQKWNEAIVTINVDRAYILRIA